MKENSAENKKYFVYPFDEDFNIPFEKLDFALITKELKGHFLITPIKERLVEKEKFFVVHEGKVFTDLESINYLMFEDVFEGNSGQASVKLIQEFQKEPNFEVFEKALMSSGFYKADRENFRKMEAKKNYEKRFSEVKNKYS